MALEGFAKAMGRSCVSLRFGYRWMNTATLNLAERLGVQFDLTVEPGTLPDAAPMPGERASGPLPDYRRVPRAPYTPSPWDFRRAERPNGRTIRVIPVTSAYLRGCAIGRSPPSGLPISLSPSVRVRTFPKRLVRE